MPWSFGDPGNFYKLAPDFLKPRILLQGSDLRGRRAIWPSSCSN